MSQTIRCDRAAGIAKRVVKDQQTINPVLNGVVCLLAGCIECIFGWLHTCERHFFETSKERTPNGVGGNWRIGAGRTVAEMTLAKKKPNKI
jgi:hypothetical protein